jgi:hypothetical protein
MSIRVLSLGAGILGGLLAIAPSTHASSWTEIGDAGSLPATAQIPTGTGVLDSIVGTIDYGDVDVYQIRVTGGGTFSAAAVGAYPLFLDPQLYLFDSTGRGVYANDDESPPDPIFPPGRAVLPAGDPLTPMAPGIYFLAISTAYLEPVSSGGFIFPCMGCAPSLVAGPSGPGGGSPITGWSGTPFSAGSYTITLTGAEFSAIGATDFYTVTPCRVVDTRSPAGPTGGPILAANSTRTFPVTEGVCEIPSTAIAVSVNLTAVGATAAGYLTLVSGDGFVPLPGSIYFTRGATRANNAIVLLPTDGTGTIEVVNGSAGAVHFVLDVNGYVQ